MAISFGGLGNGVDFGQVVSELAKVHRLPIDKLTSKKKDLQTKLTDYGSLGTKLLALQSASNALRLPSGFDRSTSTVSDEKVLTVQASAGAAAGSYTVQVTQLAKAHQITNKAANAVSSTTDAVPDSVRLTAMSAFGERPLQFASAVRPITTAPIVG